MPWWQGPTWWDTISYTCLYSGFGFLEIKTLLLFLISVYIVCVSLLNRKINSATTHTYSHICICDYGGCVMLLSARTLCFNTNNNFKNCRLIKMWWSVERFIEFFRSAKRWRSCTFLYILLHGVWPNKRLYIQFGESKFIRNVGTYPSNYRESRKYRLSQSKGKSVWYTVINLNKAFNSKGIINLKTLK